MKFTEAQLTVLDRLYAAEMFEIARNTGEHWQRGEPYYIDSRQRCPHGLRKAFKAAQPKPAEVNVDSPDFRVSTPQAFRGFGGEKVAVFVGRCVVCNCRTYCYEDEPHPDPRGALGYHTAATLQAKSLGLIGSDVPLCWECSNNRVRAASGLAMAKAQWQSEHKAFVETQTAAGRHVPGTVIEGSHRESDVLPALVDALKNTQRPDLAATLCAEAEEIAGLPWPVLKSGYWESPKFSREQVAAAWRKDGMADLVWDTAFRAMDEIAPEKHYFGEHPGNGSDFGFWLAEDDF